MTALVQGVARAPCAVLVGPEPPTQLPIDRFGLAEGYARFGLVPATQEFILVGSAYCLGVSLLRLPSRDQSSYAIANVRASAIATI
jgi:hypothetical protein